MTTPTIEKEAIPMLTFPLEDVLEAPKQRINRSHSIEHAMRLGNLMKHKVLISFEDEEGMKSVHTTIWGITPQRILLKRGNSIPVHRIHKISFH